jgi:hypothetical protein
VTQGVCGWNQLIGNIREIGIIDKRTRYGNLTKNTFYEH